MAWTETTNSITGYRKTVKHPANLLISSNPVSITSLFTRTTAIKMRKTGRSNISQTYFLPFWFSMVPVQNKTREVSQYSDYPWFSCKISDARFGNRVHCTALCLKHLERGSALVSKHSREQSVESWTHPNPFSRISIKKLNAALAIRTGIYRSLLQFLLGSHRMLCFKKTILLKKNIFLRNCIIKGYKTISNQQLKVYVSQSLKKL